MILWCFICIYYWNLGSVLFELSLFSSSWKYIWKSTSCFHANQSLLVLTDIEIKCWWLQLHPVFFFFLCKWLKKFKTKIHVFITWLMSYTGRIPLGDNLELWRACNLDLRMKVTYVAQLWIQVFCSLLGHKYMRQYFTLI